jgi:hypothetical protein
MTGFAGFKPAVQLDCALFFLRWALDFHRTALLIGGAVQLSSPISATIDRPANCPCRTLRQ